MENVKKETSLIEIINLIKDNYSYLISKWVLIVAFGLGSGIVGLGLSFYLKPKYTATLSFALIEKTPGGGGLAALASSFGLSSLMGGSQSAFSGDNLLEIIKSRYAIEQTLLTPVNYKGNQTNLMNVYMNMNGMKNQWKWKNNPELQALNYPIDQKREDFSRVQDSILFVVYKTIKEKKTLSVVRKDKRVDIVNVSYFSKDEDFSKTFVETLIDQTYHFYKESKLSQNRINIKMMELKADSIRNLYESSIYSGAGYSQLNINEAIQLAAVPKIKQQANAQLYGTVYAEVLKNLETLKLEMARETPIMQIIDTPTLPLEKKRLGPFMGIALGGLVGGILIISFLLLKRKLKEILGIQSQMIGK